MERLSGHFAFALGCYVSTVIAGCSLASNELPLASSGLAINSRAPALAGSGRSTGAAQETAVERVQSPPRRQHSPDRSVPTDTATVASPAPPRVGIPQALEKDSQPAARTTIAVDIDETLCVTDYTCVLWGIGRDNSTP